MTNSNQQRLDGVSIESHAGTFSGSFDVDEDVVNDLAFGDTVYCLVVANARPPKFTTDKNDDLKRVEVFAPEDVRIIDQVLWNEVLDLIEANEPQQRLVTRTEEAAGLPVVLDVDVDRETGEIRLAEPQPAVAPTGTRVDSRPAGSQDPMLRRFLEGADA